MTIGLPLIRAAPCCSDTSGGKDVNYHCICLEDSLSLKIFTSDDMNLETGGSVWHAGKTSNTALQSWWTEVTETNFNFKIKKFFQIKPMIFTDNFFIYAYNPEIYD